MALTEIGFKRRTYDEILKAKIAKAEELFGKEIDTSEITPLGKFIRINAYDQALTEEEAELIYYSIFPNTATGTSLDRLCVFAGISRNPATYAEYVVTFTGTAGTVIPNDFLVGTESGINYVVNGTAVMNEDGTYKETLEGAVTIGEDGTAKATVECYEVGGIGNVLPSEIVVIVNPSADIESVHGEMVIVNGTETESDYDLRTRFNLAKEGLGSCTETAIVSALLRIANVTHAGVIVNEENGSFECFVNEIDDDTKVLVAEAILDKKPIGVKTSGNIAQEIIDSSGTTQTIRFSTVENITVYVKVQIKADVYFENNGVETIKSNIKTAIDNLGVAKPVVLSSLYGQIYQVTGVEEVTLLQLSQNGTNYSTDNITANEKQRCICQDVIVEVVTG